MRAVFSLLSLVVVAAIVLFLAKKQMSALKPVAAPAGAASAPATGAGLPRPQDVGRQVQNTVDEAARRAAEAAASATQ